MDRWTECLNRKTVCIIEYKTERETYEVSCHWSDKHTDPPQSYTIGQANVVVLHLSGFSYTLNLKK